MVYFLPAHRNLIYIHRICTQYLQIYNNSERRKPLPYKATLYYLLGEPASLLVVTNSIHPVYGLPTTAPPLGFCPFHPILTLFSPHSSYYIIYIENINNLGCLRPGQISSLLPSDPVAEGSETIYP
jgi:hypothetical protein